MIVASLLLILVAVTLLVLGLAGGSSTLLISSIVASLLAAVALVIGARHNAAQRRPETPDGSAVPADGLSGTVPGDTEPTPAAEPVGAGTRAGRWGRRAASSGPGYATGPDGPGYAPGPDGPGYATGPDGPGFATGPDGPGYAGESPARAGSRAVGPEDDLDPPPPSAHTTGRDPGDPFAGRDRDAAFAGGDRDAAFAGSDRDAAFAPGDDDAAFAGSGRDTAFAGSGRDATFVGSDRDAAFAGSDRDPAFAGSDRDPAFAGAGRDDEPDYAVRDPEAGFADEPAGGLLADQVGAQPDFSGSDHESADHDRRRTDADEHPVSDSSSSDAGRTDSGPRRVATDPDYDHASSVIGAARSETPPGGAWRADEPELGFDEPDEEDPADEPLPQAVRPGDAVRVAQMDADVLVVDGRPRYHMSDCEHLTGRMSEPLPVREAVELGFSPCGLCRPVDRLVAQTARR